jgi:hypothetical protein
MCKKILSKLVKVLKMLLVIIKLFLLLNWPNVFVTLWLKILLKPATVAVYRI